MQRSSDSLVLQSIKDNNLIFVSAQPDEVYFHWQVEIYLYQFAKHGIQDRCYAVFGYAGNEPSSYVKDLAKKYNIVCYKDERKSKKYVPSIRPHIMAKFFAEYPDLGKNVFYHDSDIFLVKLPRFDLMMKPGDDNAYLSDTISYIGYNYIKDCSNRYKQKHPSLPDEDIFNKMCEVLEVDKSLIKENQLNSGGAQYLFKNIDAKFWIDAEDMCNKLYDMLCDYEKKYTIAHHIQKWTTDMWVLLWLYWKRGQKTLIHKELDFSWAVGTAKDYNEKNIFHLAGVTNTNSGDKFYKGKFHNKSVFDAYIKNKRLFAHINPNNATFEYVKIIKEYVDTQLKDTVIAVEKVAEANSKIIQFKLESDTSNYSGIYTKDTLKICCDQSVWRSADRKFIIFHNGSSWILTYTTYEKDIGPKCGGLACNAGDDPYENKWNTKIKCTPISVPVHNENRSINATK